MEQSSDSPTDEGKRKKERGKRGESQEEEDKAEGEGRIIGYYKEGIEM